MCSSDLTQIAQAHAYNDALSVGAVLEANTHVPTGAGSAGGDGLDYNAILNANGVGLMARLRIPSIDLDLPVYHGTSDQTLLEGLGHLEGTSLPVGGTGTRSGHRLAHLLQDVEEANCSNAPTWSPNNPWGFSGVGFQPGMA